MSTLKELAVDHPYYCSDSNYYSSDGAISFPTMTEFLDDFEGLDVDLNLCFRWDFREKLDDDDIGTGNYEADVFLMLQRKGIFRPISIDSVNEDEALRFKSYALRHMERLKMIWSPLWSEKP